MVVNEKKKKIYKNHYKLRLKRQMLGVQVCANCMELLG